MLLSAIKSYADTGSLSTPDINLDVVMRRQVVPAFYEDVGYTSWRRITTSITLVTGTQAYDVPDDYAQMERVALDGFLDCQLKYIGEDPEMVQMAESATINARPDTYYMVRRTTSPKYLKRLKLGCPPDYPYILRYSYYNHIAFVDDTTDVEMNNYVPPQFQWALVEATKRKLYELRFGVGDNRFAAADSEYKVWLDRIGVNKELARRNFAVFVR